MLTTFADWQRASLRPWLSLGRTLLAPLAGAGLLTAWADLALLNLGIGEAIERDLRRTVERDARHPIESELVAEHPFAQLQALRLAGAKPDRRVLVAAPYSGYASTVLSGLIARLLEGAEVLVTDWRDARLVPEAAGGFDLHDQIDLFAAVLRAGGPSLHVLALSQATVPALIATARIADATPDEAPATLSLLGGPIDPRINPTPANQLLLSTPPEVFEATLLRRVDNGHAGAGRSVLPSLHHLLAFASAHPEPYLRAQLGAWFELAGLELASGGGFGFLRSLEDLHALIDVPAELVLEVLRHVFHDPALFDGAFRVRPEAITRTALLTVEAGGDALVGPGQTHAAHRIARALPDERRALLTLPAAAHYDLFTGPLMTAQVAPALRSFMTAFDR